ncbi:MAG: Ig-like domain-containing protein [Gemmatimonadetes bacterium]|nr:Ig-like domain-containing protein [Gemmatimonadota bacterium]
MLGALASSCTESFSGSPVDSQAMIHLQVGARQGERIALHFTTAGSGGRQSLLRDTVTLQTGVDGITSVVDIARCVDASNTCSLYAAVVLLGATGGVLDSVEIGPITTRPGGSTTAPQVALIAAGAVRLSSTQFALLAGDSGTIDATILGRNGDTLSNRRATWVSRNPATASVSLTGVVRGVAPGTTVLVATAGEARDSATITVAAQVAVSILLDSLRLNPGQAATLNASVSGGLPGTQRTLAWTSRDPSVVTVDAAGVLRAVGFGATRVLARATADPRAADSAMVMVQPEPLALVGNAQKRGDSTIRLTDAASFTSGAAWSVTRRSIGGGFSVSFQFVIGSPGGVTDASGAPGADGFAVVIQSDGPTPLGACCIGYKGIPRSIAIEFDTFGNGAPFDAPNSNHVSVHRRGVVPNEQDHVASLGSAVPAFDISDGLVHRVVVDYVPGLLSVRADGQLLIAVPVDLTNIAGSSILDPNGQAWIGFTAGTGSAWETHDIMNWVLP